MGKLLVFLLVLLGIYLLRRMLARPPAPPPGREAGPPAEPGVERMVECAHCGLHIPESEAVKDEALAFCSEAHRRAHRA